MDDAGNNTFAAGSEEYSGLLTRLLSGLCSNLSYLCDCFHLIDVHYLSWLLWLFYPLVVTFLIPIVIALFLYVSAFILQLYRLRSHFMEAYRKDMWTAARNGIASLWDAHGRIWHGYDVVGLDKLPEKGGALLVYYHGAIPIDLYYLISRTVLEKKRVISAIGDRILFRIPGWSTLMETFGVIPGTVSKGIEIMKEGQMLAVAPGGMREGFFSDEYYHLLWNRRVGFAKVALGAKVPIFPVFTQNCREAFRAVQIGQKYLRKLYEKTRLPCVPLYGGFPVRMRTYIGDPILPDSLMSPEEFAAKVETALEALINKYQKRPGNILRALLERFYTPVYCKG